MNIAFFDSGLGGLSVLHHALRVLPHENFIFYADEDHVPYGIKTPAEIRAYVAAAFDFLVESGANAIVTACNTATSVAVAEMRARYEIPIIGMEPAAKKALDLDGTRRVLVIATPITVNGEKMHHLIEHFDKEHLVDLLALPQLVEFAEAEDFSSPAVKSYLKLALAPYDLANYSALVLGCTHFNYFKETLRDFLPPSMRFVDGIEGTVNELIRQLKLTPMHADKSALGDSVAYFYSGRRVTAASECEKIARYHAQLFRMEKY